MPKSLSISSKKTRKTSKKYSISTRTKNARELRRNTRKSHNNISYKNKPIIINKYLNALDVVVSSSPAKSILNQMKKMVMQDTMLSGLLMMIQQIPIENSTASNEVKILQYRDTLYTGVLRMKKYIAYQMILQSNLASLQTYMSTLSKYLVRESNRIQSGGVDILKLVSQILGVSVFIPLLINAESNQVVSVDNVFRTTNLPHTNFNEIDDLKDEIVLYGHKFKSVQQDIPPHLYEMCNVEDEGCMEQITKGFSLKSTYKTRQPIRTTPVSQFEEFNTFGKLSGKNMKIVSEIMKTFNDDFKELSDSLFKGCKRIVDIMQREPPELVLWNEQETYNKLKSLSERIANKNIADYNLKLSKQKEEAKRIEAENKRIEVEEENKRKIKENQKRDRDEAMHQISMNILRQEAANTKYNTVVDHTKYFPKVHIHPRKKSYTKRGVLLVNSAGSLNSTDIESVNITSAFENQLSLQQYEEITNSLAQLNVFESGNEPINVMTAVEVYKIAKERMVSKREKQINQNSKDYFNRLCKEAFEKNIRTYYDSNTQSINLDMDTNWYMIRVVMANLINTVEEQHSSHINMPISKLRDSKDIRIKSLYELSKLFVNVMDDFEYGVIKVYNNVPKQTAKELYMETSQVFASTKAIVSHQLVPDTSLFPLTEKKEFEIKTIKEMQRNKTLEGWKNFIDDIEDKTETVVSSFGAFMDPLKAGVNTFIKGVGEIEQTAISSILVDRVDKTMKDVLNISLTGLTAMSVIGVSFIIVMCMVYYKFVGRLLFGSKIKTPISPVPVISQSSAPEAPSPALAPVIVPVVAPLESQPTPPPPPPPTPVAVPPRASNTTTRRVPPKPLPGKPIEYYMSPPYGAEYFKTHIIPVRPSEWVPPKGYVWSLVTVDSGEKGWVLAKTRF